ncbi:MAG: Flp pilus assembly complex ATPase component TadA [Kiritimatiellae bacterium]|nr:Flp pilus assembly complex ATPase component TadA [Kiritimatiellia bacterium]
MTLTMLIDGSRQTQELQDGLYVIGRGEGCRIRLDSPEVSERHAILSLRGGVATIEDLHSSNGTVVNGEAIERQVALTPSMVVQIGPVMMRVDSSSPSVASDDLVAPKDEYDAAADGRTVAPQPSMGRDGSIAPQDEGNAADTAVYTEIKRQIQRELLRRLDIKQMTLSGIDQSGMEETAREKISEIVGETIENGRLPDEIDPDILERDVFNEAMRLGPLEDLLEDDSVSEIMVNGPEKIYVERHGRLELSPHQFTDDASVMAIIERIVSPLGRRIDESQPYVDARLADGSRVNAIIPPLSLSGPTITIRKFSKEALGVEDFIRFGTWNQAAADFMRLCVHERKNIIVAGGTGSGKTTLLNLLSGFIPERERIVTIEDAAELKLQQPHVVRLESRPANIEGRGAVTIRDLVRNALRMRPDRIIVGECRGGEALDMLQAMNTGHDGSLTTVHANSPRDVVSRLETMVLMCGMELPSKAIRDQIASAVDIIIHEARLSDGSRKVMAISEVTGMEGAQIVMQDIFVFEQTGIDAKGRIVGRFKPTGLVPSFFDSLAARGIHADPRMFQT